MGSFLNFVNGGSDKLNGDLNFNLNYDYCHDFFKKENGTLQHS